MDSNCAMVRAINFFPLQGSNEDLQEMCFLKPPSRKKEKNIDGMQWPEKFAQGV